MGRTQRIVTTVLWGVLVVAMIAVVGTWARWREQSKLPVLYEVTHFALVDQSGQPFGSAQLRGHPWVAALIFTNCPGACPMMTAKMAALQKAVPSSNIKLVSFTVDPKRDTPKVLKEYATRFNADGSRWHFLTGSQEDISQAAIGLKLTAIPAGKETSIEHSEKFLLIDEQLRVRGIYDNKDEEDVKQLEIDARSLAGEFRGGAS